MLANGVEDESFSQEFETARTEVLIKCIELLKDIHAAAIEDQGQRPAPGPLDTVAVRAVYANVDMLIYYGLLPYLPTTATLPAGSRPTPYVQTKAERHAPQAGGLILSIVDNLYEISSEVDKGIGPYVRERSLADLVSSTAAFAFSPDPPSALSVALKTKYQSWFETLLDEYVSPHVGKFLSIQ